MHSARPLGVPDSMVGPARVGGAVGGFVEVSSLELTGRVADRCAEALAANLLADDAGAMRRLLGELIGADEIWFTQLDLERSDATFATASAGRDPDLTDALTAWGGAHPAVLSYLHSGDDRRPRRISDVVSSRSWWCSAPYREGFAQRRARYQFSAVTSLTPRRGRGWILAREDRDFDDREVATAALLLPVLTVVDAAVVRARVASDDEHGTALTLQEGRLLGLLAEGFSARIMGRRLGISERTVDKHLEHLYRKLGTNDRLTTVLRAQEHGLLTARTSPLA